MVVAKDVSCLLHVTGRLKVSCVTSTNESVENIAESLFKPLFSRLQSGQLKYLIRTKDGHRLTLEKVFESSNTVDREYLNGLSSLQLNDLQVIEIDVVTVLLNKTVEKSPAESPPVYTAPVLTEKKNSPNSSHLKTEVPIDILRIASCSSVNEGLLDSLVKEHLEGLRQSAVQFTLNLGSQSSKSDQLILGNAFHFDLSNHKKTSKDVYFVTEFLPVCRSDSDLTDLREQLHEKYDIEKNRPVFRRQNAMRFSPLFKTQLIFDDSTTPAPPKSSSSMGGDTADFVCECVQGGYAYFHYLQDSVSDSGWGCAYRSLQTVWSWFLLQGYTHKPVITHREIQQTLHLIGDKPASFVGSSQWIGSFEVSYVLDHHLDVTCAFINVTSGDQLASHAPRIAAHFRTHGTPIMVGGGVLAHTICGICYEEESALESTVKYLILDPHYTGPEDLKNIRKKSVYAWKPQSFWKSDSFYNLCLPQRPNVF